MAGERIISVDSHANIPEERVLEQLPERFRGEYVEAKEAALQRMLAGKPQKQKKASAPLPNMGKGAPWAAAGRPGEYDPLERLKDMDTDGVDAEILYTEIGAGASFYSLGGEACLAAF